MVGWTSKTSKSVKKAAYWIYSGCLALRQHVLRTNPPSWGKLRMTRSLEWLVTVEVKSFPRCWLLLSTKGHNASICSSRGHASWEILHFITYCFNRKSVLSRCNGPGSWASKALTHLMDGRSSVLSDYLAVRFSHKYPCALLPRGQCGSMKRQSHNNIFLLILP